MIKGTNTNQLEFLPFKSSTSNERTRRVLGRFDADKASSDGGAVLLREAEHRFRVIRGLSECFTDHRDPRYVTHSLFSMVAQRVLAICCGYEDLGASVYLERMSYKEETSWSSGYCMVFLSGS